MPAMVVMAGVIQDGNVSITSFTTYSSCPQCPCIPLFITFSTSTNTSSLVRPSGSLQALIPMYWPHTCSSVMSVLPLESFTIFMISWSIFILSWRVGSWSSFSGCTACTGFDSFFRFLVFNPFLGTPFGLGGRGWESSWEWSGFTSFPLWGSDWFPLLLSAFLHIYQRVQLL